MQLGAPRVRVERRVGERRGQDGALECEVEHRGHVVGVAAAEAVVGGDGIVHVAIQELAHSATALGVIPAGTGNDAARYFGVPRRDPMAATDVVIAGRRRTVDLARTGPTWYLCVLSAGFDAVVNERANGMRWPRGQMKYNLATVAELRSRGVEVRGEPADHGYGLVVMLALPGGLDIQLYEPRHPTAI